MFADPQITDWEVCRISDDEDGILLLVGDYGLRLEVQLSESEIRKILKVIKDSK